VPTGKIVGIDGCRAGWLAVSCDSNELKMGAETQSIDIQVFATIEALWSAHHDASLLLVDMPIGLLEGLPRQVEPAARKGLRGRTASVFWSLVGRQSMPVAMNRLVKSMRNNWASACRFRLGISVQKFAS